MTSHVQRKWTLGYTLLMIPPFIGLPLVLFDPPRWLEIVALVAILALVYFGTRLLYRQRGGWRPSSTLPERTGDDH
ncbi:hypothetical protein ACIBCT_29805 [Streptosporangium sp. NPDC050855]|uniref:hypothetical protein n=1 Tax=Streptosporangium sp. NPDC050855 TaxID=3366194 RepID=UPI00379F5562